MPTKPQHAERRRVRRHTPKFRAAISKSAVENVSYTYCISQKRDGGKKTNNAISLTKQEIPHTWHDRLTAVESAKKTYKQQVHASDGSDPQLRSTSFRADKSLVYIFCMPCRSCSRVRAESPERFTVLRVSCFRTYTTQIQHKICPW